VHTVIALLLIQGAPSQAAADTLAKPRPTVAGAMTRSSALGPGADSTRAGSRGVVSRAQATQPAWVTPLLTQTGRLKEELRYDVSWQDGPGTQRTLNYGSGKGLELIPADRVELSLLPPPYLVHERSAVRNGFGDVSGAARFRVASAPRGAGDYVVTLIATASVPTGTGSNGAPVAVVTPTLAFGKGWGALDIQSSVGAVLPTGDVPALGRQVTVNAAVQYHALRYLWPDCEVNTTFFEGGPSANKVQVFVTPGVVVGRFRLAGPLAAVVGVGEAVAVSPYRKFDHNAIISMRFPF
jgi:hypothetical protein